MALVVTTSGSEMITKVYAELLCGSRPVLLGTFEHHTEFAISDLWYQARVQVGKAGEVPVRGEDESVEDWVARMMDALPDMFPPTRLDTYIIGRGFMNGRMVETYLVAKSDQEPWRLNNWRAAYHG